ncbi:MAG: 50S ribosomal protein L4 [Anaerolineae bacterium]|nr:50S ribosomal protein L4 [Anaerolineae bacterium]RIK34488.1 MAG: 50S ribosomal protein L4 [Chloroflexota bacterium]
MQVPLFNQAGQEISQIELRDDIFGIEPNKAVMHQAYLRQMANARQGNHQTKTRGMVRGGGKKPWKQKGTGRARQGSTRAPHWKGGGVVFGPHPRSYEQKMPKKMRHLALKSALAAKAQEKQIVVVDEIKLDDAKTVAMRRVLTSLNAQPTALVLLPEANQALARAAHNLENVKTLRASYLNVRDLLGYEKLVMSKAALNAVETFFDAGNGDK